MCPIEARPVSPEDALQLSGITKYKEKRPAGTSALIKGTCEVCLCHTNGKIDSGVTVIDAADGNGGWVSDHTCKDLPHQRVIAGATFSYKGVLYEGTWPNGQKHLIPNPSPQSV